MHDQGQKGYGARRTGWRARASRRSRALFGAKHAFDTDNDILQVRKDEFEKQFGVGIDVFVHFGFAFAVEDAYIVFFGHADRSRSSICAAVCKISSFGLLSLW